jgi:hypothetical protein
MSKGKEIPKESGEGEGEEKEREREASMQLIVRNHLHGRLSQ